MTNAYTDWAVFNDWQFSNVPYLTVYAHDNYTPATRSLNIYALARRSARKLSSSFYQSRKITISVYIVAPTKAVMEQSLRTLFANIQSQEGSLVLPKAGTQEQYTATYSDYKVKQQSGGFLDLDLIFELSDSYGYDTTYTQICNLSNQTAAANTYPYNQGGGADSQVPFIQVLYTSLSTANSQDTVTIGNQNNGQYVSVTRSWSNGDIIQIDSRNKTVKVNGVDADFNGPIPEFGLGSQVIYYTDTFSSSRNFKIFAYVYNRYN